MRGLDLSLAPGIPGIIYHFPNHNLATITSPVWCRLLALLGRGGDLIMIDLLVDCSLFKHAEGHPDALEQISGMRNLTCACA
jgi:hypothetical protein